MYTSNSLRWLVVAVSAAMLLVFAAACGSAEEPAAPTPTPVNVAAIIEQAVAAQPGITTQDVATEISKALRAQPGGVTSEEMAAEISQALRAQPGGVTSEEMASAIASALAEQPGVTTADVGAEISKALRAQPGGVTSEEMASAIASALAEQPGVTTADVAAEIAKALAAQPGVTEEQMSMAIESALKAQGVTQMEIQSAIEEAVESAVTTAVAAAIPTAVPTAVPAMESMAKVGGQLVHVPASDISFLDPSPSGILPDFYHGMLAFDHLFGMDANGVPQPQMVDIWSVSPNGRSWSFTLRDNLNFHDGTPVTTDEVLCSLGRNIKGRSVLGKLLAVDLGGMEKVDDKTFNIELTADFGLLLDTLAENAVGSAIIYTMEDCVVDPLEAADVKIGNGPMKFVEWNPGSDALYVRNDAYVPRSEPVSDYAGGKIINIDELKYNIIPDRNTRAIALETGLVDMIDFPLEDDHARLAANSNLEVRFDRLEGFDFVSMNQLAPPFDNLNARKALVVGIPQRDLLAAAYPEGFWTECAASFGCGGRWESNVGPQSDFIGGDADRARELWADSGYDGRPIKIRTFADRPNMFNFGLVVQQFLEEELDADVEFLVGDISATFSLVNTKEEAEQGNWNITMIWSTSGGLDPVRNSTMRGPWNGWGDRPEIEALKSDFARAVSDEDKERIVDEIQENYLTDAVTFIAGQHRTYRAWKTEVKDVISAGTRTYPIFWGLWLDR